MFKNQKIWFVGWYDPDTWKDDFYERASNNRKTIEDLTIKLIFSNFQAERRGRSVSMYDIVETNQKEFACIPMTQYCLVPYNAGVAPSPGRRTNTRGF